MVVLLPFFSTWISATSFTCASSSGKSSFGASEEAEVSLPRRARKATSTAARVTRLRARTVFCFMAWASGRSLPLASLGVPGPHPEGHSDHERRHQPDVQPLDARAEALDVLAQVVLHVAQVLAGLDEILAHLLARLALLGRDQLLAALLVPGGVELLQALLGVLQLALELLLLGQVALLGVALDGLHLVEGPGHVAARADGHELLAARHA